MLADTISDGSGIVDVTSTNPSPARDGLLWLDPADDVLKVSRNGAWVPVMSGGTVP